jgi:XisH protein
MSRKDRFHQAVKNALIKDGWTITHDFLPLKIGTLNLEVDLGAEKLVVAERENQKIAVEVKSFLRASKITDFYQAFGQFFPYKVALEELEPDRTLYLAIPDPTYQGIVWRNPNSKTIDSISDEIDCIHHRHRGD